MRIKAILQIGLVLIFALLAGCKGVEGGVTTLGPGQHTVTATMRGFWHAEDAEPGCRWGVYVKGEKKPTLSGAYKRGNESQAVILGTGNVGMVFWPNDKCGKWTK